MSIVVPVYPALLLFFRWKLVKDLRNLCSNFLPTKHVCIELLQRADFLSFFGGRLDTELFCVGDVGFDRQHRNCEWKKKHPGKNHQHHVCWHKHTSRGISKPALQRNGSCAKERWVS